jgi:SAM-dependent methyltransferase
MHHEEEQLPQNASLAESIKDGQRKHWNAVAGGWAAWIEWIEQNFGPITDWFRCVNVWQPGTRVLDVACGAGYPALAAAQVVRPDGHVVATDISPEMVAATSVRAAAMGLDNIEFHDMDAEQLRFGDAAFDGVTNAYGLMFCPDLQRALAEAQRVLKPGGRAAFVTWDEPGKSPFFTTILPLAAKWLSLPPPDPDAPGPFRLSDPAALASLLIGSGFKDVQIESRSMCVECTSATEYLQIFSDIAWRARIASLAEADAALFRRAVVDATRPYIEGGRVRLVATSLCVSARK